MSENFAGVYDSSTCIHLSRKSVKALLEHGSNSEEYAEAQMEFREWWNSICDGEFSISPNASYVTYDGIDLRFESPF